MKSSTLSRRAFSKGLLAAPWIARAQSQRTRARIKIDTERVIGDIDSRLFEERRS